jgi:choline dehydrogenase-like flavoprotein
VPRQSSEVVDTLFHIGPIRFGQQYRQILEKATNVQLMLHATALGIDVDRSRGRAVRLLAATGFVKRFAVRAAAYVLAAGGIENPRLLLASRTGHGSGLGNEHDLVGRFFIEHLHVPVAAVVPRAGTARFYGAHRTAGGTIRGAVSVTDASRQRDAMLGWALTFHNADDPHDVLSPRRQPPAYESLAVLAHAWRRREAPRRFLHHVGSVVSGLPDAARLAYKKLRTPPVRRLIVGCRLEQAPNPESRVTLDDSLDAHGVPRARVHWALTARDRESFGRARQVWSNAFAAAGTEIVPLEPDDESWIARMAPAAHHMGTTRMHVDPRHGVVDHNCRVHDTDNVFVAGSSVFPTGGWAPPTLTIVALALRLADHLRTTLVSQRAGSQTERLPADVAATHRDPRGMIQGDNWH